MKWPAFPLTEYEMASPYKVMEAFAWKCLIVVNMFTLIFSREIGSCRQPIIFHQLIPYIVINPFVDKINVKRTLSSGMVFQLSLVHNKL